MDILAEFRTDVGESMDEEPGRDQRFLAEALNPVKYTE
jgi:hypothetical protein